MDKAGVATSFLSCSTPGIWTGDDFLLERSQTVALSRDMNEYAARMMSDHKGRFGLFATLPLPDIDASLKEIEYAFDTLKADGVGLLTSYGNHWLGEKLFQPVFEELNRRNAIAYTHPTDAPCCHNLAGANPATLEWLTDTARSIMSMISENPGTVGGGVRASQSGYPVCQREVRLVARRREPDRRGEPRRGQHQCRGSVTARRAEQPSVSRAAVLLRYGRVRECDDAAGALEAGRCVAIVFGSDYPFGTIVNIADGLRTCGFSPEEMRGVDRENAVRILPKYKT